MTAKRDFDAKLRYLRNPPAMSMDEALASENPEYEIHIRMAGPIEKLTAAERLFWEASYFRNDTMNGGLLQTMCNDTGSLTDVVHEFCKQYCVAPLADLMAELKAIFPGGVVPTDRVARNSIVDEISNDLEIDPFGELTERFYALEEEFNRGLLKLARDRRDEFPRLQGKRA